MTCNRYDIQTLPCKLGIKWAYVQLTAALTALSNTVIEEIQVLAHRNTVLFQILKLVPRHEFESLDRTYHQGRKLRNTVMTQIWGAPYACICCWPILRFMSKFGMGMPQILRLR